LVLRQPGPFRTDFIHRSLKRAEMQIADYDRTSGRFQRLIESMDGKQIGDPEKAAEAIIGRGASPPRTSLPHSYWSFELVLVLAF
jgi:hypothetical protein